MVLKTTDIKWLSVWCRAYKIDFGHTFFKFPELKEDGSSESEPETEPEKVNDGVSNDVVDVSSVISSDMVKYDASSDVKISRFKILFHSFGLC